MNRPEGERVFDEPWQAEAFALAVHLADSGAFTWGEWTSALAAQIGAEGGVGYYEQWLGALETLLAAKGLTDREALAQRKAAWAHAYHTTPHGKPVTL